MGANSSVTKSFTTAFHYLRAQHKQLWMDYHSTQSAEQAFGSLVERIKPLSRIYESNPKETLRDMFEMEYGVTAVLTGDKETVTTFLKHSEPFDERRHKYGFYTAFTGILKGWLNKDKHLVIAQRAVLERFNATKFFYWPSKPVIFAALDNDTGKLNSHVRNIEKKFDGYAAKCSALNANDELDLLRLDSHFFCPYADIAFYAIATASCGPFLTRDSFWLPRSLIDYCGGISRTT